LLKLISENYFATQVIEKYVSLEFHNVQVFPIDPYTTILINEYKTKVHLKGGAVADFSGAGSQVWHKKNRQWKLESVSSSTKVSD